jgi:hypothetical protein
VDAAGAGGDGGKVPTVDIGYSYGAVALVVSRGWFAVFGRTPGAFIGFVTVCNLVAAWGVARILAAVGGEGGTREANQEIGVPTGGVTWGRALLAGVVLPLAIMPSHYSLMHPLEMALIVLSLAELARGRYAAALALATVALLTKPTMAYVLGLVVLVLAAWVGRSQKAEDRRPKLLWVVALPATVGVAVFGLTVAVLGWRPAVANMVPLKGAAAYEKMGFGIFHAGMDFWWHRGDVPALVRHYVYGPATFWILATLVLWGLGAAALWRVVRRRDVRAGGGGDPLLVALAAMHAAFVFKFYGWEGSWTYYAYLPVLGVLVGLRGPRQRWLLYALVVIGGLALEGRIQEGISRWRFMHREAECGGLWVYQDEIAESRKVRALAAANNGLFLVNGMLPTIWPEAKTPPVWFLSPGVLLDKEFDLVRQELREAGLVVLYAKYDPKQEAWTWEELAHERALFEEKPLWAGDYYTVYRRKQSN